MAKGQIERSTVLPILYTRSVSHLTTRVKESKLQLERSKMSEQEINDFLATNSICPMCGGETRTVTDYNADIDEDQYLTVCNDCGFTQE